MTKFEDFLPYMCGLRFGDRLDMFDYESLGVKERWSPRVTILLLTSFEMETKGYYGRVDAHKAYATIYSKYHEVVMRPLYKKLLCYSPGPEINEEDPDSIDMDRAMIKQEDLMTYLEEYNRAQVDIAKLKRFLLGQETAEIATVSKDAPVQKVKAEEVISEQTKRVNHGFRFEKRGAVWSLEYEDIKLQGVKDWVGLGYIKHLLQNPRKQIGVIDLQRLVGDEHPEGHREPDVYEEVEDAQCGGINAWEELDDTAKADYCKRLQSIEVEIRAARKANVSDVVEKLLQEAKMIERELKSSSFRPKDPEIEKNRKRVTKAIKDAIANIMGLEEYQNRNDRPLSAHLKRYIRTGSFCSYCIEDAELPPWQL